MKGIYTLVIRAAHDLEIRTKGRLFILTRGHYLYVGSAMGPHRRSLEMRIARHLKRHKKNFWHIDYLLKSKNVTIQKVIYAETRKKLECDVASNLKKLLKNTVPIKGFGSSDCKCGAHLYRTKNMAPKDMLNSLARAYRSLNLNPQLYRF